MFHSETNLANTDYRENRSMILSGLSLREKGSPPHKSTIQVRTQGRIRHVDLQAEKTGRFSLQLEDNTRSDKMRHELNPKTWTVSVNRLLILSPVFYRAESPKTEFYSFLIPVSYVFVNGIFQLFYISVVPAIVTFLLSGDQRSSPLPHYQGSCPCATCSASNPSVRQGGLITLSGNAILDHCGAAVSPFSKAFQFLI